MFPALAHRWILLIFMVLSAILQFYMGNQLRSVPMWDVDSIFYGGIIWARTGSLYYPSVYYITYLRYFAMFSIQWGAVFLFRNLYWVYSFFGGTDLHYLALLWNVAMVQAMVFSLYCAAKRLKGLQGGLFVILLLAIFLPFHFMGGIYYTDTLAMPFIAIAFSLYLRGRDEAVHDKKILLFVAVGAAIAMGGALKGTVIIILIAICIDMLLTKKQDWIPRLVCIGAMVFAFLLIYGGFNLYMSRIVIGPELIERYQLPFSYWAMVGLQGYGSFCSNDFLFTMSIPDLATRQSETFRIFLERLQEHGLGGMLNLFAAKFTINFGDGTYEMHRIYGQSPINTTLLHDIILSNGRNFNAYAHLASGFTVAMLILMIIASVFSLIKKGEPSHTAVPWLSFFGLMLFLVFSESGGRLSMILFPTLVIGAMIGLSIIESLSDQFYNKCTGNDLNFCTQQETIEQTVFHETDDKQEDMLEEDTI